MQPVCCFRGPDGSCHQCSRVRRCLCRASRCSRTRYDYAVSQPEWRVQPPNRRRKNDGSPLASLGALRHVQRSAGGTSPRTCSMCMPHPAYDGLWHFEHSTLRHMTLLRDGQRTHRRVRAMHTPNGFALSARFATPTPARQPSLGPGPQTEPLAFGCFGRRGAPVSRRGRLHRTSNKPRGALPWPSSRLG